MVELSINTWLAIGLTLALIVVGLIVGSWLERRHFRSIARRDQALSDIRMFAFRKLPPGLALDDPALVSGSVVISVDKFKQFSAMLRGILGGTVSAYESLVERARREALLRMKAEAQRLGHPIILNVKFDTVRVGSGGGGALGFEVHAYGTAYRTDG